MFSKLSDQIISAAYRNYTEDSIVMTVYTISDFLYGSVTSAGKNDYLFLCHRRFFGQQTAEICSVLLSSGVIQLDISVRIALDKILYLRHNASVMFSLT